MNLPLKNILLIDDVFLGNLVKLLGKKQGIIR